MSAKSVLLEPQHLLDPDLEHTLIVVKPDGYARGLTGEILRRIEAKGYTIKGLKLMVASRELLAEHYADHKDKPFFEGLLEFMSSGPRRRHDRRGPARRRGNARPHGVHRPDDCPRRHDPRRPGAAPRNSPTSENLVHGSDSVDNAKREISLWFPEIY